MKPETEGVFPDEDVTSGRASMRNKRRRDPKLISVWFERYVYICMYMSYIFIEMMIPKYSGCGYPMQSVFSRE